MDSKNKKILICGGHLTPAWITAKELQKNGYTNLVWIGRKFNQANDTATSPEFQMVKELGIEFIHFNTGKLWRKWNKFTILNALTDLFLIPFGFLSAISIIIKQKPDLILSFGGYVALPIVIAGKLNAKKVITHEQVISPGLASKIISFFADKILISWTDSEKFFPKKKTILTGNPAWIESKDKKSETIDFKNELPIISIVGGNQGARVINTAIFAILNEVLKFANVIHQTGRSEVTKDKYKASEFKSNLSKQLSERYNFSPYLTDNVYEIFSKSDLIIARGGANTMTDIIIKGKKCIIIPIPWSSGQEQLKNAKFLEKLGLATIVEYENEINPESLLNAIKQKLSEKAEPSKELKKLQTLIRYAPGKIFKEIEGLL